MGEKKTDCENSDPKVSVIIPVYNTEKYLSESLDSILAQTLTDIEIICVDDGSTDDSSAILEQYAKEDGRITVLRQENRGAGAARNKGFRHARGTYVFFFDSDDICDPELLEETVAQAELHDADIVAFDFVRLYEDGHKANATGIHKNWLQDNITVFNYQNCPNLIMSVINPTPWDKIYRASFIRQHRLAFDEISSSNDIAFSAVSAACAERITFIQKNFLQYRVGHSDTISSTKMYKLDNVITAVQSAVRQAGALPYSDVIQMSINRFAIDNYVAALDHYVINFNLPICEKYYNHIHEYFRVDQFADIQRENLNNEDLWVSFCTIRKHDYETMRILRSRRLIVSLTSFPFRIRFVPAVLDSIYQQTFQADEIVLYLAEEEFPEKERNLPDEVCALVREGRLNIRWCAEDLKPHKKYYYAMQEFPDDIIVTIDDDLLYAPNMLRWLYRSYLLYPDAVSTVRAHIITLSETHEVLPYRFWIKEVDTVLNEPSMYFMATGGAGTLYPPKLMPLELFDQQVILNTCLMADDLWLKTMQLLSDVPVVVACNYQGLRYVEGSQETGLRYKNVDCNENDVQLNKINQWLGQRYEAGIWTKKLTAPGRGVELSGAAQVCEIFAKMRERNLRRIRLLNIKLQNVYAAKSACDVEIGHLNGQMNVIRDQRNRRDNKINRLTEELNASNIEIEYLNGQMKDVLEQCDKKSKEIKRLKAEISTLKKQQKQLKCSRSYRLGRALTAPLRVLGRLWRKIQKKKEQK